MSIPEQPITVMTTTNEIHLPTRLVYEVHDANRLRGWLKKASRMSWDAVKQRRAWHYIGPGDLKGLREFCVSKEVKRGYVITRHMADFGVLRLDEAGVEIEILKIPAALACYWLGRSELQSAARRDQ